MTSPEESTLGPRKPKQRRNADGCQNCKVHRVKCDRQRPSCGCCVRRSEECNWSKIQFNTVNKRTNDKRTGRKAGTKARPNVLKQSQPVRLDFQQGQIGIASHNVVFLQGSSARQLPSPSSSTENLIDSPVRSSNIHQILWPQAFSDHHAQLPTYNGQPADESQIPQRLPHPYCPDVGFSTGVAQEDETPSSEKFEAWLDQEQSTNSTSDEETYKMRQTTTRVANAEEVEFPRPRGDLSTSLAFAPPEVTMVLKNPNARLLLNHYLKRTVAILHPEQHISTNKSTLLFLPFCLHSAGALEGLLAFSAAQLAIDNPGQSNALVYHKNRALSSLNNLVCQQASVKKWSDHSRNSLDAIAAAVLAQISLCVSESGTETWKLHCGAAYELLALMQFPTEHTNPLRAYMYARLLKYACFAEISHPTTKRLDLSIIKGSNLDADFGIPSLGLKLAVLISWYGYRLKLGINESVLLVHKREIDDELQEYMMTGLDTGPQTIPDAELVGSIWRTTVWLFYTRTMFNTSYDHPSSVLAVTRICQLLKVMPLNSLYSTALAYPILTIAPMLSSRHQNMRTWLSNYCAQMAKCTNTGNFLKIQDFARIAWVQIDQGQCRTVSDVQRLAEMAGYEILAA